MRCIKQRQGNEAGHGLHPEYFLAGSGGTENAGHDHAGKEEEFDGEAVLRAERAGTLTR